MPQVQMVPLQGVLGTAVEKVVYRGLEADPYAFEPLDREMMIAIAIWRMSLVDDQTCGSGSGSASAPMFGAVDHVHRIEDRRLLSPLPLVVLDVAPVPDSFPHAHAAALIDPAIERESMVWSVPAAETLVVNARNG